MLPAALNRCFPMLPVARHLTHEAKWNLPFSILLAGMIAVLQVMSILLHCCPAALAGMIAALQMTSILLHCCPAAHS